MCLNVRRFPPPSSRIDQLHYIGAEAREEGGTRCQRALAAEGDRSAEEIGQQEVAETASGCSKRWCWSKRRTGGTEDSLPCSWVEEGVAAFREGAEESAPFAWRLKPAAIRHVWGRSREEALAAGCPRPEGAIASRQEAEQHRAVHQRGPVPSHGTASEPLSWLRTERQRVREPDRDFFFPLSPLSSLSLLILPSPFSRLVCPYPQVRRGRPDGLPRERGEGGSRAQSREYPPACEGRWGYVTSGAGPRAVGTERGRWSE